MNIIFEKRLVVGVKLKDGAFYQNCECGFCKECRRSKNNYSLFICNQGEEYDADSYEFLGDMTKDEAEELCFYLSCAGYEAAVGTELEPIDAENGFCVSWS